MLTNVHALGFWIIVAAACCYAVWGLVIALTQSVPRWTSAAWVSFLVIVAAEGAVGVAVALTHTGPTEGIHWVYGTAILLVLLVGNGLAVVMPARRRGATMVIMAAVTALLAFRLMETG